MIDYALILFAGIGAATVLWYVRALVLATIYVFRIRAELTHRIGYDAMKKIVASEAFSYLLKVNFKAGTDVKTMTDGLVRLWDLWQARAEARDMPEPPTGSVH